MMNAICIYIATLFKSNIPEDKLGFPFNCAQSFQERKLETWIMDFKRNTKPEKASWSIHKRKEGNTDYIACARK